MNLPMNSAGKGGAQPAQIGPLSQNPITLQNPMAGGPMMPPPSPQLSTALPNVQTGQPPQPFGPAGLLGGGGQGAQSAGMNAQAAMQAAQQGRPVAPVLQGGGAGLLGPQGPAAPGAPGAPSGALGGIQSAIKGMDAQTVAKLSHLLGL